MHSALRPQTGPRYTAAKDRKILEDAGQHDDRSNLWILSGQSNACGRGLLPGPKAVDAVRMFSPGEDDGISGSGEFVAGEDPLPGMGSWGVGPWVAAAQAVSKEGHEIDMLGYALGNRSISHWSPGSEGESKLFSRIKKQGKGAGVFLWYQGESDTGSPEDAAAYCGRLADLVARVRDAAENPDMTVVIIQLSAMTIPGRAADRAHFMTVREAQRQFVIADGNALLVTALGRVQKDDGHVDTPGHVELGAEIARALLRNRFNQTDINWPGPVLDAAVLAPDSRKVTARFAEVRQLSQVTESDFVVIDVAGPTVCKSAKVGATTLQLTFDRLITLPARFVYGYGDSPKATLVDEDGNRAPAVQTDLTSGSPPADKITTAPNGAGPKNLAP